MDNGEEIQALNESWTLAGAKLGEWISGLVMCMVSSEAFNVKGGTSAPFFGIVLLGTTLGLAAVRRRFPDEERGVRNFCMVGLGFAPPGIPTPATLQPQWSGAPVRELPEKGYFRQLKLEALFPLQDEMDDDLVGEVMGAPAQAPRNLKKRKGSK